MTKPWSWSREWLGADASMLFGWVGYVAMRGVLRVLVGRRRRGKLLYRLGLHHLRPFKAMYISLKGPYEPHIRWIVKKVLKNGGKNLCRHRQLRLHVSSLCR